MTTELSINTETTEGRQNGTAGAVDVEAGAPKDTRERILDVALDLFTEQGFDGTSLREIAEQLGVTKAALYYHFESKEDILLALHMRLHEFSRSAFTELGDGPVTLEEWDRVLGDAVGQIMAQRKLFLLHERNQTALEKMHRRDHEAEHEDLQNQLRRVLNDSRVPVSDRIKMAGAIGVVFSSVFVSGESFSDVPVDEMTDQLRAIIHNVLFDGAGSAAPG